MSQTFPCAEQDCNKSVSYKSKRIPAVGSIPRRGSSKVKYRRRFQVKRIFTVYLTCSSRHCHPYVVSD